MARKSEFTRIMHYVGWKGDSSFIKTGEKPRCSQCTSKKLQPAIELVQKGFTGDKVWLVAHCKNCLNTTIFEYELIPASEEELNEMTVEQIWENQDDKQA